jgi:hypothetical protein
MERSKHHTAWAGALAVAAELSRNGYDAAITLGNTPTLDLICSSPGQKSFTVQVKSISSSTFVLIQKKHLEGPPRDDLYFAVVLVPPPHVPQPFVFYILTHTEVCDIYGHYSGLKKDGQPYKGGMEGLSWADVKAFQDRWDKLPS